MKIRAVGNLNPWIIEEELHLLIDEVDEGYEKLRPNIPYGQIRNTKVSTV